MSNVLPRWRGFNLTEMHLAGSQAPFRETDFETIAQWGFDFVRLPLAYTHWTRLGDPFVIDEAGFARVDQAVGWGRQHGLHVSLCLHRAPGYCVNQELREPFDLWRDAAALDAFCLHWQTIARRYVEAPAQSLSFNLLNEPPTPRFWPGGFNSRRYARVMRAAAAAIREIDPTRLLIVDGLDYGRLPCPELSDFAQSCRAYDPVKLTHYRADWMNGSDRWPEPRWTSRDLTGGYRSWGDLVRKGVGVHCSEMGCHRHTPRPAMLGWFEDTLAALAALGIGWALWNLRGPFGVLDSERADVKYERWGDQRLDRELLELLQRH